MPAASKLPTTEELQQADRLKAEQQTREMALRGQLQAQQRHAADLRKQLDESKAQLLTLAALRDVHPPVPLVRHKFSGAEHQGIMLVNWSDWHVAEIVESKAVQGRNKYNPEVARARASYCAQSTRRLWLHNRASSYKMDTMVLMLGGDFITGYLHEELAQTNAMPPVEEGLFARELLASCLEHLLEEKTIKRLHVVCMRGNHARNTRKIQFKNDFGTSHETWIYSWLAEQFSDDVRVTFDVPPTDIHVVKLTKDLSVRFFHGHQVKYQDGVGGLTIPLNKWLHKQDKIQKADINMLGHFHMFSQPTSNSFLNGANKGWDEFALSHGFPYQPPLQTSVLVDVRRKLVSKIMPVFCEPV
jgi:Calcineurin-like phosphoesterase